MLGPDPLGQGADHLVVGAAFARRLDELAAEPDILVAAARIDVVVLEEHGRRQDDVGHGGRLRHELLMDGDEQIVARETPLDAGLIGRDRNRVGVLHQHGLHGWAAAQRVGIAAQDRADPRLVEHAHRRVAHVETFDDGRVPMVDGGVVVEGPAALVLPGTCHRRDAGGGVHVGRAVAAARKAVAEPEEGPLRRPDEMRKRLDLLDRQAGDGGRPGRIAFLQVRFELVRHVGIFRQVVAVGESVTEQHVHNCAGERAVGARPQAKRQVGLPHRVVLVDVYRHDRRAALLAGADRVGHHVDLGRHGVCAPDDHAIGLRHLARVRPHHHAGAGDEARPGGIDADGREEARIALGVPQPVDSVAHHPAHRTGVVVGPNALRSKLPLGGQKALRNGVERLVPRDAGESTRPLRAGALQWVKEPVRMVDALGVAGDLRADDAGRVGLALGPMQPANRSAVDQLDFERAGGRTIVGAGRVADVDLGELVHAPIVSSKAAQPNAFIRHGCENRVQKPCTMRRDRRRHWRGSPVHGYSPPRGRTAEIAQRRRRWRRARHARR